MEPQKPGNSSGSGPEVIERQESRQRVSGARESAAGQCRMRSEISAGAVGRILDSANPREIRT